MWQWGWSRLSPAAGDRSEAVLQAGLATGRLPWRMEWGSFVLFRKLLPAAEKRVAVGEGQRICSSNIFLAIVSSSNSV